MPILRIIFARWATEIGSGRRTVALVSPLSKTYAPDDEVQLLGAAPPDEETGGSGVWQFEMTRTRGQVTVTRTARLARVVSVRTVRLLDVVDADLAGLGADTRAEFLERWDAANPSLPADGNPEVSRVEWRYDDLGPEWALAV